MKAGNVNDFDSIESPFERVSKLEGRYQKVLKQYQTDWECEGLETTTEGVQGLGCGWVGNVFQLGIGWFEQILYFVIYTHLLTQILSWRVTGGCNYRTTQVDLPIFCPCSSLSHTLLLISTSLSTPMVS